MKKTNILLRERLQELTALLTIPRIAGFLLICMVIVSCEEEEQQSDACGEYIEFRTERYRVTKADLQNGKVPGGYAVFAYEEYENVGKFVFSYSNTRGRCSKNPDGMDYISFVDAWVYSKEWVDPDLVCTAEIEMPGLGRKPITPVATGAGANTYHLACTNGWMDLAEKDESENIITRFSIGYVDFPEKETIINYLVDSLKLEIRYIDYSYRVK